MDWVAAEIEGHVLRFWPDGGEVIERDLDVAIPAASLRPEIEHTVSLDPQAKIVASGLDAAPVFVPCKPPNPVVQGDVMAVPPVAQASPAGRMTHEVSRIAGLIAKHPDFDGVACVVGAQTVWAQISAEEIVSFQSVMTGDLAAACGAEMRAGEGFDTAVSDVISRPQSLTTKIASLHAARALDQLDNDAFASQICGVLIGAELSATRPYWLGQRVAVIGASALTSIYAQALSAQGAMIECHDGEALALAGLSAP